MTPEKLCNYLIPVEESFNWDGAKKVLVAGGKAVLGTIGVGLRNFAIFTAALFGLLAIAVVRSEKAAKRAAQRLANPTPEERESLQIFEESWKPALLQFKTNCKKDFDKWNRQHKDLNYDNTISFDDREIIYPQTSGYGGYCAYGVSLINFDYGSKAYNTEDPDDYRNGCREEPLTDEIGKSLQAALKTIKPLIDKWKSESRKFSPYFEMLIDYQDNDPDYPYIDIVLRCKWVDKDGIIKPNLPAYKG